MGNKTYKDVSFKLGSTGAYTDITAYLNQHSLKRTLSLIEDSAYSDANRRYLPGLAGTTVSLNGWVNTTTDGIFGPLVAASTSVAKGVEFKAYTARYYNGSAFFTDVQYSGSLNNMQTFSVNLTFDGAVNRTSVALT